MLECRGPRSDCVVARLSRSILNADERPSVGPQMRRFAEAGKRREYRRDLFSS